MAGDGESCRPLPGVTEPGTAGSAGAAEGAPGTATRDAGWQGMPMDRALSLGAAGLGPSSPIRPPVPAPLQGNIIRPRCREMKKNMKSLIPREGMLGPSQPPLKEGTQIKSPCFILDAGKGHKVCVSSELPQHRAQGTQHRAHSTEHRAHSRASPALTGH